MEKAHAIIESLRRPGIFIGLFVAGFLRDYRKDYEKDPTLPILVKSRPFFRRALFTVGLLLRHFDFTDKDVIQGLEEDIKDQVCDTLAYFVQQPNEDIQLFTLKAIGSLCIRHYDFMLGVELKTLYHRLLTEDDAPLHMRTQVMQTSKVAGKLPISRINNKPKLLEIFIDMP